MKTDSTIKEILANGGTALDLYDREEERRSRILAAGEIPDNINAKAVLACLGGSFKLTLEHHYYRVTYNKGPLAIREEYYSTRPLVGVMMKEKDSLFADGSEHSLEIDDVDYKRASLARTKRTLLRLIMHNYGDWTRLATLTFKKACHDRAEAFHYLNEMTIRFKKVMGYPLNYIAVPELHPGGHGYHFHLVINNEWFDYSKFILQVWKQGIVKISERPKGCNHNLSMKLSGYLVKYVEKEMLISPAEKKRYTRGGVWSTDWLKESGNVSSAERLALEKMKFLKAHQVPFESSTFEPYDGQVIYKIAYAVGQHPGLDLTPFEPLIERPRSHQVHHEWPKLVPDTQAELNYEI